MPTASSEQRLQPQDAFAELARVSLVNASVPSVMDTISQLTKRTLPGAAEVSVTLVEHGRARTVAFTGALAMDLDERQYERGYGPCLGAVDGGEPVHITDMRTETRWADWTADAHQQGVRSSLSLPVPLERTVTAALNIYGTAQDAFRAEDVKLASTFATYAGVALTNIHLYQVKSRLAEDLATAMTSRAVIEQAKGILMVTRRCTADEAFNVLVWLSQNSNRKLREVAQALVDQAGGDGRT
jgi:GAF domain-containing protein